MPGYGKTCQLCHGVDLNVHNGKGEELTELDHLETFKFLAGSKHQFGGSIKPIKAFVCPTCSAKVRLISSLRSESIKVKTETDRDAVVDEETKEEEEDVDLEELDQLSLFYAEHDNIEKDPDFAPNSVRKVSKRLVRKPKIIPTITSTINITSNESNEESNFSCQMCPNKNEKIKNVEDLRHHFINIHDYGNESRNLENPERNQALIIICQFCSHKCVSRNDYMSHTLSLHSEKLGSGGPSKTPITATSMNCETCQRTFRRKTTLISHQKNCFYSSAETHLDQTPGCKICGKDILPSRMAAHRSFEHICKICDDHNIFANRKEKCQHLEIVHKWWTIKTMGKAIKALKARGEVPCPREGCLQKFPRGSRRLKTHIKRDHDQEGSTGMKRLFECNECHALLKSSTCLKKHKDAIHGSIEDRTKCPYCDFSVGKWRKHSLYRYVYPKLTILIFNKILYKTISRPWKLLVVITILPFSAIIFLRFIPKSLKTI